MQTDHFNEVTDSELALQVQGGSLLSFERLVYRHEARIFRFLLKCCRDESDARELTQITFVTGYQCIQRYDPAHSFSAWLFTIARRKFIDQCRRERPVTNSIPEGHDENDPATVLENAERRRDIWNWARGLLSPDQFQTLWLSYQEDMSIKEIAQALNRTQISVKVLMFRAKKQLSRACGQEGIAGLGQGLARNQETASVLSAGRQILPRRLDENQV